MNGAGIGAAYGDATSAALHADELARRQASRDEERQRRERLSAAEVRAFRAFETKVSRTAGFAATSIVYASDFGHDLELLDERLSTPRRVDAVLTEDERARLTSACVDFASALATGKGREAQAPFRAALAEVQAGVLARLGVAQVG